MGWSFISEKTGIIRQFDYEIHVRQLYILILDVKLTCSSILKLHLVQWKGDWICRTVSNTIL